MQLSFYFFLREKNPKQNEGSNTGSILNDSNIRPNEKYKGDGIVTIKETSPIPKSDSTPEHKPEPEPELAPEPEPGPESEPEQTFEEADLDDE
jgi:hypothetical protein